MNPILVENKRIELYDSRMGYYKITCEKECGEIFLLYVERY